MTFCFRLAVLLLLTINPQLLFAANVPAGTRLADSQSFTRMLRGDPESLDPHLAIGIPADHVARDMFEGLVTEDTQNRIIPGQAERWTVSENGKIWRFHLRRNLKWSDGTSLTAADFEYSFRRLASPKIASPYAWFLESIGIENAHEIIKGKKPVSLLGVEATDAETLTIRLNTPTPFLLSMLTHRSMLPVPKHMIDTLGSSEWVNHEHVVSNGPFQLVQRVVHEKLMLARNPQYWNKKHTILDQVTYIPIESEPAALSRYRAGDIDLLERVPPTHLKMVEEDFPDQLVTAQTLSTYYITFNTRRKPFDDARVRRALSYAIQRERIANDVLGFGKVAAYTFAPEAIEGFTPPEPPYKKLDYSTRITEAHKLLLAAGFDKSKPLELVYTYNNTDENRRIAVVIQKMWQSTLPVKVQLVSKEWATYLQDKIEGHYQVARALWMGDYNDAMTMLDMFTPEHANNSSFYNNPEYNTLLATARQTIDHQERNRIYQKAELILAEDMPVAPLFWDSSSYLIKPDLKDVSYKSPLGRVYSREIYRVK